MNMSMRHRQNVNRMVKPVSVTLMEHPVTKPGTPQSEAID